MSASLVRKGLEIVDPDTFMKKGRRKRIKKKLEVFGLVPDNHKYITKTKGVKANRVNLLSANRKLTIIEARKNIKSKEQILRENLRKLDVIRNASKVKLDKSVVNQIIDRAVTRKPINKVGKLKKKKDKKTAFTEEDFRKFEEEYLNE